MKHVAFFGDGEKTFALTPETILELERKTGIGIGALYGRFLHMQVHFADIIEIIRLGLIGGGMSPAEAQTLVDTYAKPRPIMEVMPLAFDILEMRWSGKVEAPEDNTVLDSAAAPADNTQDDLRHAAATGDASAVLRARIAEAYADLPDDEADADEF